MEFPDPAFIDNLPFEHPGNGLFGDVCPLENAVSFRPLVDITSITIGETGEPGKGALF
jgi:hypothetical protein